MRTNMFDKAALRMHQAIQAEREKALTERQLNVGAAYLAAIDTGRLVRKIPPLTEPEILAILAQIDQAQAMEDTALFALRRFEFDYFKKELRHGDPYFVAAIKENLPWLFKEATS